MAAEPNPNEDAAHALFAAIAQIGLALRESQSPVSELGSLFSNLAETLTALRSVPFSPGADDPVAAATARGLLEQLQTDVFKGIQQLQFHDRMVQHLSHLQAYLIGIANELSSRDPGARAHEVWNELHIRLRKRLISDEQRGLLDLFVSPQTTQHVSTQSARPDYAAPGSFELF